VLPAARRRTLGLRAATPIAWLLVGSLAGCRSASPPSPAAPILPPPQEKGNSAFKGQPSAVEQPSPAGEPQLIVIPPEGGELYGPVWSPASDQVAFCSFVDDPAHSVAHASVSLYTPKERKLLALLTRTGEPKTFHRVEYVAWSPTGDRLVVSELVGLYESEGDLVGWVMPASGRKPLELPGDTEVPAWSPDGKQLARLRLDQTGEEPRHYLDVVPADARSEDQSHLVVRPGEFEFIDDLAWSPDGRELLCLASRKTRAVVALADIGDGPAEPRIVADLGQNFGFGTRIVWSSDGKRAILADNTELLFIDVRSEKVERRQFPGEVVGYSADAEVTAFLVEDRLNVVLRGNESPQMLLELDNVEDKPVDVAFAPDLSKLVICADGKLWLHEFAKG